MNIHDFEQQIQNLAIHLKNFLIVDSLVRTVGLSVADVYGGEVKSEEIVSLRGNLAANLEQLSDSIDAQELELSTALSIAKNEVDATVGFLKCSTPLTGALLALTSATAELDVFEPEAASQARRVDLTLIKSNIAGHLKKVSDASSMLKALRKSLSQGTFVDLPSGQSDQMNKAVDVVVDRAVSNAGMTQRHVLPASIYRGA